MKLSFLKTGFIQLETPCGAVLEGGINNKTAFINSLVVPLECRRGGVGAALVKAFESHAQKQDADIVCGEVFAGNRSGISFWKSQGFCISGVSDDDNEYLEIIKPLPSLSEEKSMSTASKSRIAKGHILEVIEPFTIGMTEVEAGSLLVCLKGGASPVFFANKKYASFASNLNFEFTLDNTEKHLQVVESHVEPELGVFSLQVTKARKTLSIKGIKESIDIYDDYSGDPVKVKCDGQPLNLFKHEQVINAVLDPLDSVLRRSGMDDAIVDEFCSKHRADEAMGPICTLARYLHHNAGITSYSGEIESEIERSPMSYVPQYTRARDDVLAGDIFQKPLSYGMKI